jgi:hypothetical protein
MRARTIEARHGAAARAGVAHVASRSRAALRHAAATEIQVYRAQGGAS